MRQIISSRMTAAQMALAGTRCVRDREAIRTRGDGNSREKIQNVRGDSSALHLAQIRRGDIDRIVGHYGIDVSVAQTLISEIGLDMARWPDEHHFASWLGLCPDNRITGGKVIRRGTRHVINRAATALRIGATTLLRSQSYLGAQYRRLRGKLGAPKAITAMAHKLAALVYRMLRWGHEYVDKGMQYYEERHREQQIRLLKKRAAALGLVVV